MNCNLCSSRLGRRRLIRSIGRQRILESWHEDLRSLKAEQTEHLALSDGLLAEKTRDGACHEMVMWYIHHLSESARKQIKKLYPLPLLPEHRHTGSDHVQQRYEEQVTCGVCHVADVPESPIVV